MKTLITKRKKCATHGITIHIRGKNSDRFRCKKCRVEGVTRRRQKVKQLLVTHFGGKCTKCGYNKCIGALQFHHLNPRKKDFSIASGSTWSYKTMLKEASKCILICANCHAEIHAQ